MVYDPVKRREQYLRTRQLKGRRKGSLQPTSGGSRSQTPTHSTANSKKQQAEARLAALKQRLEQLRDLLAKKVEQAKSEAGVETKKDASPNKATSSKSGGSKGTTTAKEKRENRERYEKYKKENPDKPASKDPSVQSEIEQVQKQIREVRQKLKDAVEQARQRSKDNSKTAVEGR